MFGFILDSGSDDILSRLDLATGNDGYRYQTCARLQIRMACNRCRSDRIHTLLERQRSYSRLSSRSDVKRAVDKMTGRRYLPGVPQYRHDWPGVRHGRWIGG